MSGQTYGGIFSGSSGPQQEALQKNAEQAYNVGSALLKTITNPGDVTDLQKAALGKEKSQETSAWDAYLSTAGLSKAADTFDTKGLVNQESLVQQMDWSQMDLQGATDMLGISATDALAAAKMQLQEDQASGSMIAGAAGIIGSIMAFV